MNYLTIEELKEFTEGELDDTPDWILEGYISSVSKYVENITGLKFYSYAKQLSHLEISAVGDTYIVLFEPVLNLSHIYDNYYGSLTEIAYSKFSFIKGDYKIKHTLGKCILNRKLVIEGYFGFSEVPNDIKFAVGSIINANFIELNDGVAQLKREESRDKKLEYFQYGTGDSGLINIPQSINVILANYCRDSLKKLV